MQAISPYGAGMCWFRFYDRETALVAYRAVSTDGEAGSTDDVDEMVDGVDAPRRLPGGSHAQPSLSRISG